MTTKKSYRIIGLIGATSILTGCAIHPLPIDYTGDATYDIVKRIRCEIRYALIKQLVVTLKFSKDAGTRLAGEILQKHPEMVIVLSDNGLSKSKTDMALARIRAEKAKGKKIPFTLPTDLSDDVFDRKIDKETADIIEGYLGTGITYKITFTITETNDGTANVNFAVPFTGGTFKLDLSGGTNRQRKSERILNFTDVFKSFQNLVCYNQDTPTTGDFIYPITGKIGMEEVIKTYARLAYNIHSRFTTKSTWQSMTDELTFTTKLTSSVKPSVELNPGRLNNFKLSDADLNLSNDRQDIHKVLFTIKPPAPPTPPKPKTTEIPLAKGVVLHVDTPTGEGKPKRSRKMKQRKRYYFFKPSPQDIRTIQQTRDEQDRELLLRRSRRTDDLIGQ